MKTRPSRLAVPALLAASLLATAAPADIAPIPWDNRPPRHDDASRVRRPSFPYTPPSVTPAPEEPAEPESPRPADDATDSPSDTSAVPPP